MGAFTSRRNAGVEEVDISTTNAYRYPPKSGCYFGSYFIMGGERFDTTQPEAYLFGENQDLNFLGNRPIPFPYPAPQANEPTKTLKSLVYIRKESLRFLKIIEEENQANNEEDKDDDDSEETPPTPPKYNLEFTFDTDARVAITIYYFASEEISNGQAIYHPRDAAMNSETFRYKRGANQTFSQTTHIIDPSKFQEEEWLYNPDKEIIPVVIQCVVEDEAEHAGHSHMTFGNVERSSDGGYVLKPFKQKQMVDGLCYLLQEIYGIENKNADRAKMQDDEIEDNGSECVICMSDIRDTLILPCRHLCLCNVCADSLRYQANNCPICRVPFRALLQIRAMRKKLPGNPPLPPVPTDSDETPISQEGVPPGYEAVSLIEALNGPNQTHGPPNPPAMPPDGLTRGNGPSMPTSPEESPVLDKRKGKGRSSARSNRSVRNSTLVEEGEEATETAITEEDGRGTPEVVMTEQSPDPVKSPESPKRMALPKMRYPSVRGPLDPSSPTEIKKEPLEESVKFVNETGDGQELQFSENVGAAIAMAASEEELALGLVPDGDSSPPPGYEEIGEVAEIGHNDSLDEELGDGDAPFKPRPPAAHTAVMFNTEPGEDRASGESEPLCVPPHTMDSISLPGTPLSNTDGSSYSSTSSTRVLLSQGSPGKTDDEKPDI